MQIGQCVEMEQSFVGDRCVLQIKDFASFDFFQFGDLVVGQTFAAAIDNRPALKSLVISLPPHLSRQKQDAVPDWFLEPGQSREGWRPVGGL